MLSGVLVIGEMVRGLLTAETQEALALAYSLASDVGDHVTALVVGRNAEQGAREAVACGANLAFYADSPGVELYQPEVVLTLAEECFRKAQPNLIVLPHSAMGSDLAPRLAYHLGTSWAPGCTGLRIENGTLIHTRPVYGGKVLLDEAWDNLPAVITLRPKSHEAAKKDWSRQGQVECLEAVFPTSLRIRTVERVEKVMGLADKLAKAEVVVAGGRGMGSGQAFDLLKELAGLLGGAVGSSKKAVDLDWVPYEMQVGMTGTAVAPRLYLAVGISGAPQHMMGCSKAKTIVAINKDPEAPIFQFAHYGIVDDWQRVLPALVAALKEMVFAPGSIKHFEQ